VNTLTRPTDKVPLSGRYRAKRNAGLRDFITSIHPGNSRPFRILDLGGTPGYWLSIGADFLESANLQVTCVNRQASELSARRENARINREVGDACALSYADRSFDFIHSNSVIEHVGSFRQMIAFAGEVRRLAPSYYVQTPYVWFPIDPHFYRVPLFHWAPLPLQARLLKAFPMDRKEIGQDLPTLMGRVESRSMLDVKQFRFLFPDAEHSYERAFGLPKSLIAQRRGFGGS
jgi:hypothetical protein